MDQIGYGAQTGWGSEPLGLSPETEQSLAKAGWINDYKSGHKDFMKSANEAVIRPAVAGLDATQRAVTSTLYGAGQGLQQTAKELSDFESKHPTIFPGGGRTSGLATVLGGTGEVLSSVPQGFGLEFAPAAHVQDFARSRSVGAVGEGEAGYFDVKPPTPENIKARNEAAQEAGTPPVPPEPPPVDVHELARRIDPDTMEQYDALAAQREEHRLALSQRAEARENLPEAKAAQAEIDTILGKVHGVEDRLTDVAKERLVTAQNRLDTTLGTDTPEMAASRDKLMKADFAMRDLAPQVTSAYRQARDMAPELPMERPPEQVTEAATAKTPEVKPEEPQRPIVPPIVDQNTLGSTEPPNVLGEEKIGAGTPEDGGEVIEPPKQRTKYGNLRPVQGTGELRTRGLSQGVESKAIENGLVSNFGDLPEYRAVSMADQAARASDLIAKDYESAKSVALGQKQPPQGLLPESVFVAVEKQALAEGDVETLRQLATQSKLATEATTMGQRIRTLGERDPTSPVGAIQAVQEARLADLKKRGIDLNAEREKVVSEVKSQIGKPTKDAWSSFINEITCAE
jgi:hypothetical protein